MNFKNVALWLFIAFIAFSLFNLFGGLKSDRSSSIELTYSQFLDEVDAGSITDVEIKGKNISGRYSDGKTFNTYEPNDPSLVDRLNDRGVNISAVPLDDGYPSLLGIPVSYTHLRAHET